MQTIARLDAAFLHLFFVLTLMLAIVGLGQSAYGASAGPSSSSTAGGTRQKANVYFEKGEKYQRLEKYAEAEEQYRRAIEIDSKYAEAYSNLGFTLRKQGEYDEAVEYYKKAIELDDRLAEAYEYLGEAYAEMGQFDQAEKTLKKLRRLDSGEADELAEFIREKQGR